LFPFLFDLFSATKMTERWKEEDEAAAHELHPANGAAHEELQAKERKEGDEEEPDDGSFDERASALSYAEIVKRLPIVRQSYVEGSQGEVGAAVAGCHQWRQRADACFRQLHNPAEKQKVKGGEAQCMKLQLQFMLCTGERVLPQQFDRLMGCMKSKGDIGQCEQPLLEIMNGLEKKAQIENRQRDGASTADPDDLLTSEERQRLLECTLTGATQHEIDCMIPKVCGAHHDALLRCVQSGRGVGIADVARCIEPAKQALHCWGAFNYRRARYEEALNRSNKKD
jgi:hypothetical protein